MKGSGQNYDRELDCSFINMYQVKRSWKVFINWVTHKVRLIDRNRTDGLKDKRHTWQTLYSHGLYMGWGGGDKIIWRFFKHNTVILLTFLGSIVVSSILLGSFLLSITGDLKINKKTGMLNVYHNITDSCKALM